MSKGVNAIVVQSSPYFASVAKECLKDVNVLHVSDAEISTLMERENLWFKDAPSTCIIKCIR